MKKISFVKNKKHVIYAKKSFVWIKMVKNIKVQSRRKTIKTTICNLSDLECLLKKVQSCQNNPERSYTKKKENLQRKVFYVQR